jgi:hypothetical protein
MQSRIGRWFGAEEFEELCNTRRFFPLEWAGGNHAAHNKL